MAGTLINTPFYTKSLVRDEGADAVAKGLLYVCRADKALGTAEFIDLHITTGAGGTTTLLELNLEVFDTSEMVVEIYEDAVPSVLGTPAACLNLNRIASAKGIDALKQAGVYIDSTFSSLGTKLADWPIYGEGPSGGEKVINDVAVPLVLKRDTSYVLRIIKNLGGGAANASIAVQYIDRTV